MRVALLSHPLLYLLPISPLSSHRETSYTPLYAPSLSALPFSFLISLSCLFPSLPCSNLAWSAARWCPRERVAQDVAGSGEVEEEEGAGGEGEREKMLRGGEEGGEGERFGGGEGERAGCGVVADEGGDGEGRFRCDSHT